MQWFLALPRRSQILVAGLAALAASQFLVWLYPTSTSSYARAGVGAGAPVFDAVVTTTTTGAGVIGWRLHPFGAVVLPALLFVHGTGAIDSAGWRRWGVWVTLALMAFCARIDTSQSGQAGPGFFVGWAAVLVAALAVFAKGAPAPASPAAPR